VASLKPEDGNVVSRIFGGIVERKKKINVIGTVNNDIITDKGAGKSPSL